MSPIEVEVRSQSSLVVTGADANWPNPCNQLSGIEEETSLGSMEVTVSLPEGFLEAFNDSDVNIDMEFDPEGEGSFSSAAITLDDGVLESSFNGKGMKLLPAGLIPHTEAMCPRRADSLIL